MKSRTSFFNGYALWKDITRYLPVWLLYTVFLSLVSILMFSNQEPYYSAASMEYILPATAVVNFIYALICAATLFSDLYTPRMCYALHTLPVRREGWMLTHTAAGLLFSLVPNLLVSAAVIPLFGEYYIYPLIWLGVSALQYLFFFGLSILCAFCAGSRLGMVALYGILNFFSLFAAALCQTLYIPLLHGLTGNFDILEPFSPLVQMASCSYISTTSSGNSCILNEFIRGDWIYLAITAGIGIVFSLAALMVYRHRNLENAGDFLSVRWLSPLFLLIFSLISGLFLYLFSSIFTAKTGYLFLFVGMLIGYFAGSMLVKRTVRVFGLKSILGFVLIAVLTGGSLFLTSLDPLKLTYRVPEPEAVRSCSIWLPHTYDPREITDSEEIESILELHRVLCQETAHQEVRDPYEDRDAWNDIRVYITYQLNNGKQLHRSYAISADSQAGQLTGDIMGSWKNVLGVNSPDDLRNIETIYFDLADQDVWNVQIPRDQTDALLKAIQADCDAGQLTQIGSLYPEGSYAGHIEISWTKPGEGVRPIHRYLDLSVYDSSTNTLDFLQNLAETMHNPEF